MKVSVEIITGTFLDPEVSDNATVRELKEKIATDVKLPVKRLVLVVENEKCEEERTVVMDDEDEMMLRDLGVRENSHMYLFIKDLDLVSTEERSQGGSEDGLEDSEPASGGGNEEEEEEKRAKIEGENEAEKSLKNEDEDRDGNVEDEIEEEEKNGDREEDGEKEAMEGLERS